MATPHKAMGGRFFTFPVMILTILMAIGAYYAAQRFIGGIGYVANINDGYPWGIWVVIDIVVGTAFGCGGFAMALLVYIFNKGQYHPLVRPALLGGLFGYTLAGIAVVVDLGRYWQGYNILLPAYMNISSVMLEVGLCVAAYITVLWIEFSPAFFERLGMQKQLKFLKKYMWVFIALGVLLPTMHQSSLGTMLIVLKSQMSPLYQTNLLPLLFLISAVGMGYSVVMFEAVLISKRFRLTGEEELIMKLGRVVMMIVSAFFVLRWVDLVIRGAVGEAFNGDLVATMFWIENVCYGVAIMLLATARSRRSERNQFIAACLMLAGGSLYRIDAYLVAYDPVGGPWHYFPSFGELMITVGVIALEIFLYLLFVKKLPVLYTEHKPAANEV